MLRNQSIAQLQPTNTSVNPSLGWRVAHHSLNVFEKLPFATRILGHFANIDFDYYRTSERLIPTIIANKNDSLDKYKKMQMEDIYRQYLNIRYEYKQDYYIAMHGQATQLMIINDLIKQIEKIKTPEAKLSRFKFFRIPSSPQSYSSTQDFINKHSKQIPQGVFLDHYESAKLISVDLCDENIEEGESVYYFLNFNTNICPTKNGDKQTVEEKLISIIDALMNHYQVDAEKKEIIAKELIQLGKKLNEKNSYTYNGLKMNGPGNLYVICLPKSVVVDKSQSVIYLSREGGLPLKLQEKETASTILDALQNRDRNALSRFMGKPNTNLQFFDTANITFFPQGRIIISELTPESGVKIFRINSFSKEFKKEYKEQIKQIADNLYKNSKQQNLVMPEKSSYSTF